MSDPSPENLPGEAGTSEGESGASESDPVAPSVEGRPVAEDDQGGCTGVDHGAFR